MSEHITGSGTSDPKLIRVQTQACLSCGETSVVTVDRHGFNQWCFQGEFIQNAFPDMSAEDRELLLTGTHPKCWNEFLPGDGD